MKNCSNEFAIVRFHLVRAVAVLVFLLAQTGQVQASDGDRHQEKKLNVLLIIADDLSANALGCYGNTVCKTPHLDQLASRGMLFERAYCQFPVCGPSRAAMMSGLYCQSIGVLGNGMSSKFTANMGRRQTMSQYFKDRGWYSARVSKIYHMRVPGDITAGVDGPDHANSWTERFNCQGPEWMSQGKHEHLTNEKLKRNPNQHYNLGFGGAFYTVRVADPAGIHQPDKLAADRAIQIMRQKKDEPFFLAVGLVRPHVPLVAPESYFQQYDVEKLKVPKVETDDWNDIPKAGISKNSTKIGLDTIRKKQKVLQAYYASVTYMDHQVGRLMDELKKLDLDKKTIVVFKSDHGYHLGEHEFWQKMSLHEESARIPLIISAPGTLQGQKTRSLAEAIDLYPTLVDLNGLDSPVHCQGKSLKSVLNDSQLSVRKAAFCTTRKGNLVRTDKFAFIQYQDKSEELYDMVNDPGQVHNLASSAKHASTLESLRLQLKRHLDSQKSIPTN